MPFARILFPLTLILLSVFYPAHGEQIPPQDAVLSSYQYPFPVSYSAFSNQQQTISMAYMDVSPKQNVNGLTVLLLHGKNFNAAYWQTTMEALLTRGFRVIAPDQIGFGKSSKPAHYQFSFEQLASNTRQLLQRIGVKKTIVLGHSMGGMLASRFALMYPEMTNKLVLVNPIGLEDYRQWVPWQSVDDWYQKELSKDYSKIRDYQQKNYYDGQWNEEFDHWARLAASWTQRTDYPQVAWNGALTYDMIYTQPVVHNLEQISVPTLLIIGTRDRTALGKNQVPPEVREKMGRYNLLGKVTRDKIPGAKLKELANVGHLPHIEAFDRFINALIPFIAR